MARSQSDEYGEYEPVLAEFAGLDPADPRRTRLRAELVAGFLPVARNIARRFTRRGEPLDDLEQVAAMGLLLAIERFDPGRDRNFLSYAVPTIMGEVRRYFRDATWTVRTPRSLKERHLLVGAAVTRMSNQLGRAPTLGERAEHLEIDRDAVAEALAVQGSHHPASLDAVLDPGRTGTGTEALVDTLGDLDPGLGHAEQRTVLRDLVRDLPERERTILVLRFIHDRTQAEIGAHLCISQMHVSRLLNRTLALLRDRVNGGEYESALLPAG